MVPVLFLVVLILENSAARPPLRPRLPADDCKCLNWKDVYLEDRTTCGEGMELLMFGLQRIPSRWHVLEVRRALGLSDVQFCVGFFHRMDDNRCVKPIVTAYGETRWFNGTWCYVNSNCPDLNGGHRIADPSRNVSVKFCTAGRDKRLSDLDPMALMDLGKQMHAVIGQVVKLSYPRLDLPGGTAWPSYRRALLTGDDGAMPELLRQARRGETPIVIDASSEGSSLRIVAGDKVYALEGRCEVDGCYVPEWTYWYVGELGDASALAMLQEEEAVERRVALVVLAAALALATVCACTRLRRLLAR